MSQMSPAEISAFGDYVNHYGLPLVILGLIAWFFWKAAWPAFLERIKRVDGQLEAANAELKRSADVCSEKHERITKEFIVKQDQMTNDFSAMLNKQFTSNQDLADAVKQIAEVLEDCSIIKKKGKR